jgi:hypothetical protein
MGKSLELPMSMEQIFCLAEVGWYETYGTFELVFARFKRIVVGSSALSSEVAMV